MIPNNIGPRKFKALMVEKGKIQQDLADLLGISTSAVNGKINGRIPWRIHECAKIATIFGLPIENIFSSYFEKEAVGR